MYIPSVPVPSMQVLDVHSRWHLQVRITRMNRKENSRLEFSHGLPEGLSLGFCASQLRTPFGSSAVHTRT